MSHTHLVLVPHTHWDREWYRTHEAFRYRLVRLLDALLDLLEGDPSFRHFTLDGQTIVLDDYLEVRPQARERIAKLVREGRLLIGPWTVLPDEWLVSGEALVRNLHHGLARAAELGGAMRVGYVPDQFGHVGQLPQIFAGFGFESAVLWRGVGADVDETAFAWEAPDGSRLFTAYLRSGYGEAGHLPLEPDALARRLESLVRAAAPRTRIPTLLLMNGGDHAEPQAGLPAALASALQRLRDVSAEIGTLPGFLERARRESPPGIAVHRGELRSGLRAPLLEGCASSRAPQKRAEFRNDRLLTRYLEPLATWLGELGGDGDAQLIRGCWRVALENHPHDSVCGCSIDAVHDQMDARFARVADRAGAHLERVARELGERVTAPPASGAPGPVVLVWNPGAGGRAEAEGVVEADVPPGARRAARLSLRDAAGRRIPVHAEFVDRGHTFAEYELPASVAAVLVDGFPPEFFGFPVCAVRSLRGGGRLEVEVLLGREPTAGFDLDRAKRALRDALRAEGERPVIYRPRLLPRVKLRFVDEFPGCGLRAYRLQRGRQRAPGLSAEARPDGGAVVQNDAWRIEVAPDGRVDCVARGSGTRIRDAVRLVSEGDRGDTYSFDPVPGAPRVERPSRVRVRLGPPLDARASLVVDARYRVPAELTRDRARRSERSVWLPVQLRLGLAEGLDRVELDVRADNTARDHRLRIHLRAPFAATRFEVESAFEVAQRPVDPELPDREGARPAELPIGATPQQCFATISDGARALSVANRGSREVEAVREPGGSSLAVSLLRAVGWLSRDDLALRPGHAGPPLEVPGAQVPGPHRAELAWRLHAADDPHRIAEAHRFAHPPLVFGGSGAARGPLRDGDRLLEIDDPAVVVSAIEPRRESAPVIRLWNASGESRRVRVRWRGGPAGLGSAAPGAAQGSPRARGLERVDLDGRARADARLEPAGDGAAWLALGPWQIAGLRPL